MNTTEIEPRTIIEALDPYFSLTREWAVFTIRVPLTAALVMWNPAVRSPHFNPGHRRAGSVSGSTVLSRIPLPDCSMPKVTVPGHAEPIDTIKRQNVLHITSSTEPPVSATL